MCVCGGGDPLSFHSPRGVCVCQLYFIFGLVSGYSCVLSVPGVSTGRRCFAACSCSLCPAFIPSQSRAAATQAHF